MSGVDILGQVVASFGAGGEIRDGQARMVEVIEAAIEHGNPAVITAPTGTGKSLAYLIPAIESGQKVLVATATKALQEQLVTKELPTLRETAFPDLTFTTLKGRSNYLCELAWEESRPSQLRVGGHTADSPQFDPDERARIDAWREVTTTGDRDELRFNPSARTWASVSTSADDCAGKNCPHFEICHFEQVKDHAAEADVVVANIHLLIANMIVDGHALPPFDVLVIDEAHELEDIAAEMLGVAVSSERPRNLANILRSYVPQHPAIDALTMAPEMLKTVLEPHVDRRLEPGIEELGDATTVLSQLVSDVRELRKELPDDLEDEDAQAKADRARAACSNFVADVNALFGSQFNKVTFVQRRGEQLIIRQCSIDVAPRLADALWPDCVPILTSATIPFNLQKRVGLPEDTASEIVESPFDFQGRAVLYVSKFMQAPRNPQRNEMATVEARQLIEAAGGRTLYLCSSYAQMHAMREALDDLPYRLLMQGEASRAELLSEFTADERSVLFATMSFWTGVDVPGPALQLVIIDRIPFPVPTDPIIAARDEAADNGFIDIHVAHAATRLAQGAGRLMRTSSDVGVVAVLDPRLATKSYRKKLLEGMPPFRRSIDLNWTLEYLRWADENASSK